MQSDDLTFGWIVDPLKGVSGETIRVPNLADNDYDVQLYHTWRGQFLDPISARSAGGSLTVKIPESQPRDRKPRYFGPDIAFKIVRQGAAGKDKNP
jgi:hypothetical protein